MATCCCGWCGSRSCWQRIHDAPVTTLAWRPAAPSAPGRICSPPATAASPWPAPASFPGPAFGLVLGTARLAGLVGRDRAREILLAGREIVAEAALMAGLATAVLGQEDIPGEIARAAEAAGRLDPATVAALHRRTSGAEADADLAALVRSAAGPA